MAYVRRCSHVQRRTDSFLARPALRDFSKAWNSRNTGIPELSLTNWLCFLYARCRCALCGKHDTLCRIRKAKKKKTEENRLLKTPQHPKERRMAKEVKRKGTFWIQKGPLLSTLNKLTGVGGHRHSLGFLYVPAHIENVFFDHACRHRMFYLEPLGILYFTSNDTQHEWRSPFMQKQNGVFQFILFPSAAICFPKVAVNQSALQRMLVPLDVGMCEW